MEIVETSVFTKQIRSLLKDDEYRELQERLLINPLAGPVIRGSGGIRVIYYYVAPDDQIFMLVAYGKAAKDDLTEKEVAALKKLVKEEFA